MSLPSCMFAGDQAGILVGIGALEAGGCGVVFRFSSGFKRGDGYALERHLISCSTSAVMAL